MGTKTKIELSHTISLLLIVSLKLRAPRKANIIEAVEEVTQPLRSMSPSWQRKIRIKPSI